MAGDELPLAGGNVSPVVRVGDTVRKPWLEQTDVVHDYLRRLRHRGIDVPEPRGRDEQGRQVLEYVPGTLALHAVPMAAGELERIGRLVRAIHDASAGIDFDPSWPVLLPAANADLVCHNDLAPWNLIIGDRTVFIDWDGAGPSTRLWDLAYSASAFAFVSGHDQVEDAARRLRAFLAGYRPADALRAALPDAMFARVRAMYDLLERSSRTGRQPWARMFGEGHGEHWQAMASFVGRHLGEWRSALSR